MTDNDVAFFLLALVQVYVFKTIHHSIRSVQAMKITDQTSDSTSGAVIYDLLS